MQRVINTVRIGPGRRSALSLTSLPPGFTPPSPTAQASIDIEQAALSIGIDQELAQLIENYLYRCRRSPNGTRKPPRPRTRWEHLRIETRGAAAKRLGWTLPSGAPDLPRLAAALRRVETLLSDPEMMARLQCAALSQTDLNN